MTRWSLHTIVYFLPAAVAYSQQLPFAVHGSSLRDTTLTAASTLEAPSEEKCRPKDGLHIQIRKVSCAAGIAGLPKVDRAGGYRCVYRVGWRSTNRRIIRPVVYSVIEKSWTSYTKEYVPRARRRQLICGKELPAHGFPPHLLLDSADTRYDRL